METTDIDDLPAPMVAEIAMKTAPVESIIKPLDRSTAPIFNLLYLRILRIYFSKRNTPAFPRWTLGDGIALWKNFFRKVKLILVRNFGGAYAIFRL